MVDFSDLDDKNLDKGGARAKKDRPTFPCQSCAGTGQYQSPRVHQEKSHCFACGGKGFFYTSPFDRQKKREAARNRKADAILKVQQAFDLQHPGVIAMAREFGKKSEFMRDLVEQYGQGKLLTERQVEAIRKFAAKRAEFEEQRRIEQEKRNVEVDLSPIHAMFESARKAGLKRLSYRAENLIIKPASEHGKNVGALYVKAIKGDTEIGDDAYLGKIVGTKFIAQKYTSQAHIDGLHRIAINPVEAAKAYGKLVGRCSCCGRALTDPHSIELGIGPICAEHWFGMTTPGPTKAEVKAALKEAEVSINTNYGAAKTSSVAGKYDHLYKDGMTAKEKQAIRAKARKEARA